ncbi:class I SAM-dependent methyltransferase [Actinomadura flavalba]|uniref:class I SAM-dependent methyltransferase n=1 Tax=Actinomadura flavalba TaxID=1120938 RepID=UPI00037A024D|nr:class I SAM-dependent methyltransferase [Actinomadura flavalba]
MIGPLYARALDGAGGVEIEDAAGHRRPLPVETWRTLRPGDRGLLDRARGPVLDVGSGPGRLTVALTERGVLALGIDVAASAIALTVAAGGPALCRDVFGPLPGEGDWGTVLLADGNIGIGGDPVALLRRARRLAPSGRVLAELAEPGLASRVERLRLRRPGAIGEWFPWAHVSAADIVAYASVAGFAETDVWEEAGRWFAVLE